MKLMGFMYLSIGHLTAILHTGMLDSTSTQHSEAIPNSEIIQAVTAQEELQYFWTKIENTPFHTKMQKM